MEYKNISSKFTLEPQTKYKNTEMETCLQGLLPRDIKKNQKIYSAKVSYCQNSDISIIKQYTVAEADLGLLQHLLMEIFTIIVNGIK